MKNVKILTAVALLLCVVLSLCACNQGGNGDTTPATTGKPNVRPTAPETLPTENITILYTVTIKDESGNPVVGAMIQLCKEMCVPNKTNENGVAVFTIPQDTGYKCSFLSMPEGYTYSTEETEFYFEEGSREMTIVLKAVG